MNAAGGPIGLAEAGVILAGLGLLLALLRPRRGGLAAALAVASAALALRAPRIALVVPRPRMAVVLAEDRPGVPEALREPLAALAGGKLWTGRFGGAPRGRWLPLAALLAGLGETDEDLLVLLGTGGLLTGLEEARPPRERILWSLVVAPPAAEVLPGLAPALALGLPRPPRAGRPWLLAAGTGPWPPGAKLRLQASLGGVALAAATAQADTAGRGLFRVEMPPAPAGRHLVLGAVEGPTGRVEAGLAVTVGPPPRLAVSGPVANLLATQGFAVEALVRSPGPEVEAVVWESGSEAPPGPALREFLAAGGGLLGVGEGLPALAGSAELAAAIPWRPLPPPPARAGEPGQASPAPGREGPPAPPQAPPAPPREKEAHAVALVLVLDLSGSMTALTEVVKQACAATARALDPEDRMAVVAFADQARLLIQMGPAREQVGLLGRLHAAGVGGSTCFWPPLDLARTLLAGEAAAVKTVLLFTDGMMSEWGSRGGGSGTGFREPEGWPELRADFRRRGISISAVVYEQVESLYEPEYRREGRKVLDHLATGTGGSLYQVRDPRRIVQVFLAEADRISSRRPVQPPPPAPERPAGPEPQPPSPKVPEAPEPAPLEVFRQASGWVAAGLPESLPPVRGIAAGRAEEGFSWVPLAAGPDRYPLLLLSTAGPGRVGLWAADSGARQAEPWVRATLLGPLLGRVATALLKPQPPPPPPVGAVWSGDGSTIALHLPSWPPAPAPPVALAKEPAGAARPIPARWLDARTVALEAGELGPGPLWVQAGGEPQPVVVPPGPPDLGRAAGLAACARNLGGGGPEVRCRRRAGCSAGSPPSPSLPAPPWPSWCWRRGAPGGGPGGEVQASGAGEPS